MYPSVGMVFDTRVFAARADSGRSAASSAAGCCRQMSGTLYIRQSNMQKYSSLVLCGLKPARFQTPGVGAGDGDMVSPHQLCGVL